MVGKKLERPGGVRVREMAVGEVFFAAVAFWRRYVRRRQIKVRSMSESWLTRHEFESGREPWDLW